MCAACGGIPSKAQADFSAEGKIYKKVGLRYSGEITYFASSQALKRPLNIDFNKFGEQQFHGLASLQLHAMPLDPAKGREVAIVLCRAGWASDVEPGAQAGKLGVGLFGAAPGGGEIVIERGVGRRDCRNTVGERASDQGVGRRAGEAGRG